MPPRRLQICRVAYWIAVVCLFAFAAWKRFSLPLDPIADPDTWGYLGSALQKLTGSNFGHEGRNFVYPAFLFVLLRLFGDFRAITITQHLLGLAAGGLLLMTWRRARVFVAKPGLSVLTHNALGLVGVAIFLVAGEPIRAEMQIRPESICAFLLGLNLWLAVDFIAGTLVEKRALPIGLGAGLAITAVLLASIKPSFILLALISLLPVGISFLRAGFLARKIWLAAGAIVSALLFLLPEYFLGRDDDLDRAFLPTTLFVVHADMIRDQMADDLNFEANLPYSREWLSRVHADLSTEMAKSTAAEPEHYFSLGFSPDYLMYQETSIVRRLGDELRSDNTAATSFYRFYYWRTWRQRPLAMLRKIARQMAIFYAPICPAYDRTKTMSLTVWYQLAVSGLNDAVYAEVWKAYPPAVEFMKRAESLAEGAPPIEQRRIERGALTFLAVAYSPLLGITLLLGAATFFWSDYRRRLGWLVALTLFVFLYNAAACLEVAIVNSLEVPRYSTVQVFFTLLAEFLGVGLLLDSLFSRIRWGRPIQTSAPGE